MIQGCYVRRANMRTACHLGHRKLASGGEGFHWLLPSRGLLATALCHSFQLPWENGKGGENGSHGFCLENDDRF